MKTAQILEKLVKFNTVDDKDNSGITKFLSTFLTPLGFKIQMVKNKTNNKINLLAKYNKKKPVLTFSGHTDTVPETTQWTQDPFNLTSKGDKLYGLGTSDMKGGIASILATIQNTNLNKLNKGLNLVFTYGEEVDLSGVQDFLKKVKLKTKYVILAEDTGLKPRTGSKGAYAIKIEFQGKAAHGSEVNKGVNAILIAQEFIEKVKKLFVKVQQQKNSLFAIPFSTLNIAKIAGGDLINRVPAYCCLDLEYRTVTQIQGIRIYQEILKILQAMNCKFKISLDLQIRPMITKNKDFISVLEKITKAKVYGGNGTTEGSFYSKYGYDCIILGPGSGMAHEPNEFITKNQLIEAEQVYKKVITTICK